MLTIKKWGAFIAQALLLGTLVALLPGCAPTGAESAVDGERLRREGHYPEAIAQLRRASTLLSTNPVVFNHLALAYHQSGDLTNAIRSYRQALNLARDRDLPLTAKVRYNLGSALLEAGELPAAANEFQAYTVLQPRVAEGWIKLGTIALRSKQWDLADRSFNNARLLSPRSPEVFNGLGTIQYQRRRYQEASNFFFAAVQIQRDYAPALLNLATIDYLHLNNRVRAVRFFKEYLQVEPKDPRRPAIDALINYVEAEAANQARLATNLLSATLTNAPVVATNPPRTVAQAVANPKTNPVVPPRPVVTNAVANNAPRITPLPVIPPPAKPAVPVIVTQAPPERVQTKVVAVEPPPVIARDPAPPAVIAKAAPTNASTAIISPVAKVTPPPAKKSLLAKANPLNWFGGSKKDEEKKPADLPRKSTPLETVPITQPDRAPAYKPEPKPAVTFATYTYQNPARPTQGDSAKAAPFLIEGFKAVAAGKNFDALEQFQKAAQADPSSFDAQLQLAISAHQANDFKTALPAYETALALQPASTAARYNFALGLDRAGYVPDAAREYEKVLAKDGNDVLAHFSLASLCARRLQDNTRAREHYRKVLELDAHHPQAEAIRLWLSTNP